MTRRARRAAGDLVVEVQFRRTTPLDHGLARPSRGARSRRRSMASSAFFPTGPGASRPCFAISRRPCGAFRRIKIRLWLVVMALTGARCLFRSAGSGAPRRCAPHPRGSSSGVASRWRARLGGCPPRRAATSPSARACFAARSARRVHRHRMHGDSRAPPAPLAAGRGGAARRSRH